MTYLFYELQRKYEIAEKIHKLTPVVLVANEVPSPNEFDEDWIIAHDYIIRRAILDDSFLPALDFISTSIVGEEFSLEVQEQNIKLQRTVVNELKTQVETQQDVLTEIETLKTIAQSTFVSTIKNGLNQTQHTDALATGIDFYKEWLSDPMKKSANTKVNY